MSQPRLKSLSGQFTKIEKQQLSSFCCGHAMLQMSPLAQLPKSEKVVPV